MLRVEQFKVNFYQCLQRMIEKSGITSITIYNISFTSIITISSTIILLNISSISISILLLLNITLTVAGDR